MKKQWLVGIDEAGRGPLAGPVAVGVAVVPAGFNWELIKGVNDSKQLSEPAREEIFTQATILRKAGKLDWTVAMVSAKVIDRTGIVPAITTAIERACKRLEKNVSINVNINTKIPNLPKDSRVVLDGGLKAPDRYQDQETIIKGDSKEPVIGLASIMAKVTRDRYMCRQAKNPSYTPYNFDIHKGYGTKRHRESIAQNGLSTIHRHTYCKNIKVL